MLRRPSAELDVLAVGLLTGAMLVIAVVLVPYWAALPADQFRGWFVANAHRVRALTYPLAAAAVVLSVAASALEEPGSRARSRLWVAAGAVAAVLAITIFVNEGLSARFAAGALPDADRARLLTTWVAWHWARVGLGVIAFVASIRAVGMVTPTRPSPPSGL